MHKRLQKIAEEIIPLSRKQNLVLLLLIACVFQFLFFATPALAAAAPDENDISIGSVNKTAVMDPAAQAIIKADVAASSTPAAATSTKAVPKAKVIRTSTHVITAYNSEASQTDASPCITANGFNVCKHGQEDTIAANFLKMGTKVKIPELFGEKVFTVRDRMSAKHPNRVDVWMTSKASALKFGVKTAKIQVLES